MEKRELTDQELEDMARYMAAALDSLDCPDCCGPVHQFIEAGADVYRDHFEWSHFVIVITQYRRSRCAQQPEQDGERSASGQ